MPNTNPQNHKPERQSNQPAHPSPAAEHGHGSGENTDWRYERHPQLNTPRARRHMTAKYHHV